MVHGYPGSSLDFAGVADLLKARVFAMDLLGFGQSDKPLGATYSLFAQADLVEALLQQAGIRRCVLVGHDMGTSVVAELVARHNRGELSFDVEQVVLTNGSIFIDMAQLTAGQRRAEKLNGRPLPFGMPRRMIRRGILESVAPGTNVSDEDVDDLVNQIRVKNGSRVLTAIIAYLGERRRHQEQWTAAFVEYPGPMLAIWGTRDPVSVTAMPVRLRALRPQTRLVLLDDVGHWPTLESPRRVAEEITAFCELA